jgi:hypothetical protein
MLRDFVNRIDRSVIKTKDTKLGVRIYYALYPDSSQWDSYPDLTDLTATAVAGKHTIFMVPTYRYYYNYKAKPIDVDFDVNAVVHGQPKPFKKDQVSTLKPLILGFPPKKELPVLVDTRNRNAREIIENHGGISPPPDNGIFPTVPQN